MTAHDEALVEKAAEALLRRWAPLGSPTPEMRELAVIYARAVLDAVVPTIRAAALREAAEAAGYYTRTLPGRIARAESDQEKLRLLGVSDGRKGMEDWLREWAGREEDR